MMLAALARPRAPSETSMVGAGIRIMRAAHASAHSLCARCQARIRSLLDAISTTASRLSQMPSRKMTSEISPVYGAIGHRLHIHEVLRQKVDLLIFLSAMESLDKSHLRKNARSLARESILRTDDEPQAIQRHLCLPEDVTPFFRILAPQSVHLGLFTRTS